MLIGCAHLFVVSKLPRADLLSKMLISGKLTSGSTVHIETVSDGDVEAASASMPSNKRARTLNYRIEKTISIDGEEGNEWMDVEDVD